MKMKKIFLIMSVTASLFMTGCSQDEPDPNGGEGGNVEGGTTSYLSVNMVNSDGTASRAQAGYEDGTADENKITSVRFYFFNAAGGAVNVKLLNGSYVNYYDWDSNSKPPFADSGADNNNSDDIEKKLNPVIVINTKNGDKLPSSMVAVINPTGLPTGSVNLTTLQGIKADYASSGLTQGGNFVMFNAVTNKPVQVEITKDNLQKTPELAKGNPVKLYVERSVAKVKVGFNLGNGVSTDKISLNDKDGNPIKVDGKQVYLKIDGWSLTAETTAGRLVKKVNPAWGAGYFQEYRSCWAINEMSATNRYYNYETGFLSDLSMSKYTNENAQLNDIDNTEGQAKNKTKVILKGTLIDKDNAAFTIVRHLGAHFADTYSETPSENLPLLKNNILSQLRGAGKKYYYETTVDGKNAKQEITAECLQIIPVENQLTEENKSNNCYVYAQLTDDAKTKKWFTSDAADATELENAATVINGDLKNKEVVDWALVWKDGSTYYFYEIRHSIGQIEDKGVVRNHIYDTKVTKIAGLGTPVYDPSLTIYPETPKPNEHYVAAQIMVLSWHVVSDNYELEWEH